MQKFEIPRLTNELVQKLIHPSKLEKGYADPQVLFDYRCHTPVIGTQYPPKVQQCMQRIAAMDVGTVLQHYGLLDMDQARNLQARATGEALWDKRELWEPHVCVHLRTQPLV